MAWSAWTFSILATTKALFPIRAFRSMTSAAWRTKDRPMYSTPRPKAKSRSTRSFSVRDGARTFTAGRLIPFRLLSIPPRMTSRSVLSPSVPTQRSSSSPSSSSTAWPGEISWARGA